MIIDFHAHTFPEDLAARALQTLSGSEHVEPYTDGTGSSLSRSMSESGVHVSVLLPVTTKPAQTEVINRLALETNRKFVRSGILSFGGVHPENEDYREILRFLVREGVKGIKLHPIFQRTPLDDPRYQRIVSCAEELGLITVVHAGLDLSNPEIEYSAAPYILGLVRAVKPRHLVLAHMGSWGVWGKSLKGDLDPSGKMHPGADRAEEALEMLSECASLCPIYLDTSYSFGEPRTLPGTDIPGLDDTRFLKIREIVGTDHMLFGTDSPWTAQAASVRRIRQLPVSEEEKAAILGGNAAKLLGFPHP